MIYHSYEELDVIRKQMSNVIKCENFFIREQHTK